MAIVSDVAGIISKIAPPGLAEQWDNSGFQVGDPTAEVSRIMVALDAGPEAIESALAASCHLLVTHHPLIFKPLKAISTASAQGRLIHAAIKGGLSVISMHTSYDLAEDGLNDLLAERLGLLTCQPLQITTEQELVKLVVFVPAGHLDRIRSALFPFTETIGNYRDCSFATPGEGTYMPQAGATPFIGAVGVPGKVSEERLELLMDRMNLPRALRALLAAHPYEEPAFDIYPLANNGKKMGLGRIGNLAEQVSLEEYALQVKDLLAAPGLRYVGKPSHTVKKVAVCSGSGASLLHTAARTGADVLVTGDIKYHDARDAESLGIGLIDAGHFATEIIMVNEIADRLNQKLSKAGFTDCQVLPCASESDPFRY